jgi:hypothetical protein
VPTILRAVISILIDKSREFNKHWSALSLDAGEGQKVKVTQLSQTMSKQDKTYPHNNNTT